MVIVFTLVNNHRSVFSQHTEFHFTSDQGFFRPFALGNIPYNCHHNILASVSQWAGADLHRKNGAILSFISSLKDQAARRTDKFDSTKPYIQTWNMLGNIHHRQLSQFWAAVTQKFMSTFVEVEVASSLQIDQENCVNGFIHDATKLEQFFFSLFTFLQCGQRLAKLFRDGINVPRKRTGLILRPNGYRGSRLTLGDVRDRFAERP